MQLDTLSDEKSYRVLTTTLTALGTAVFYYLHKNSTLTQQRTQHVSVFRMNVKQVAQLSQRDRAMHELLRFVKLRSGSFEPPFWGLRGNVDASCVRRWKKRGRLPIGDN